MEIILLQNIDNVGDKHTIVSVKDGFGRNYLIPKGLAIIANEGNRKRLVELKRQEEARDAKRLGEFQEVAEKLKDVTLKIAAKAGTSGKIFGSVTNVQIAHAIKEAIDYDVDRRKIVLPEEVKVLGNYTAEIQFHPEVQGQVQFEVIQD